MIIDLSDCEEYKEFFFEAYPELTPDSRPYQFQVNEGGISYWSEERSGEYSIGFLHDNPVWQKEVVLLKKLFPEAFI